MIPSVDRNEPRLELKNSLPLLVLSIWNESLKLIFDLVLKFLNIWGTSDLFFMRKIDVSRVWSSMKEMNHQTPVIFETLDRP